MLIASQIGTNPAAFPFCNPHGDFRIRQTSLTTFYSTVAKIQQTRFLETHLQAKRRWALSKWTEFRSAVQPFRMKLKYSSARRSSMSRRIFWMFALGFLCVLVATDIAKGDSIDNFKYQSDGNTFVWQLPGSPVPAIGDVTPGIAFVLNNIPVSENGGPPTPGSFMFFSSLSGGLDLNFGSALPINAGGPQLYSGLESNPTFLLGTFQLTDYAIDTENGLPGTLVVSSAQVPEPLPLVLLGIGFMVLAAGLALRRMSF